MYISTHLEDYVETLYHTLNIRFPSEISIEKIAKRLNIGIHYWDESTEIVYKHGKFQVFINEFIPFFAQWVEFAHELGHSLLNYGHQLFMPLPFRELQEWQATNFAYHFCVPTFMLRELDIRNIYTISETFNVDYEFAVHRLNMYERRMNNARIYYQARQ